MKQITLISHYNGIKLNLRVSDSTYNALRLTEFPIDKINNDAERIKNGYEPRLLSRSQHLKINTFFAKDNTEYFDKVEFSPSSRFIDLGLPSGRLWAAENEAGYHQYDEAVKTFGGMLPSIEAWEELFDECSRKWNKRRKGYVITGPNGNTIFLPAKGWQNWNEETKDLNGGGVYGVGCDGHYWSSSPYGVDRARRVYFYSGYFSPLHYNRHLFGFSVRLCKTK